MENTSVKVSTIIRTVVLALALINQLLVAFGCSPIPIEEQSVELLISTVATVVAAVWGWWKNNSFTKAAIRADEVLSVLKTEKKSN